MDAALYETLFRLDKTHWWLRGRRRIVFSMLDRYAPGPFKTTLDVGCGGNNINTLELGRRAKNVVGLDSSDEAIRLAKKYYPELTIIKGTWPDFNFKEQFDCITFFDVLEHIDDEALALKKAQENLTPGGTVLLTLPALSLLWSEHDEIAHHKRRYTKSYLKKLIKNNTDLRIERITYFNTFLFPVVLGFRLAKRILGIRSAGSDFFTLPSWLNNFFEFIFGAERFLLRSIDFPIGVSLLCILSKPRRE
jgi:SAM-dependent methyltransferase